MESSASDDESLTSSVRLSSSPPAPQSSPSGKSILISSPDRCTSASSSSTGSTSPRPKRKHYELSNPEISQHDLYWPQPSCHVSQPLSGSSTNFMCDAQLPCLQPSEESALSHQVMEHNTSDQWLDSESDQSSVHSLSSDEDVDLQSNSVVEPSCSSLHSNGSENESASGAESSDEWDGADFQIGSLSVFSGSGLTVDDGVLALMDLFTNHKLDKKTVESILKALLCFLPKENNLPKTKYMLFQYVESLCPMLSVKIHYYCKLCHIYLGLEGEKCPLQCNSVSGKFHELPLFGQIKSLFENHYLSELIDRYADERSKQTDKKIRDICDGLEFKRVKLPGQYDLTLLGHTDGVSISISSTVSLWPLEFVICELPPHLRFKFVLIGAVWVDSSKPNMHCFMKPCVEELKELNTHGVSWIHPTTKEEVTSFVISPVFCADAPVRAQIQNILSHNGKYSCNTCEQKTVKLPREPVLPGVKKKRRPRVYMPLQTHAQLRTHKRMEAQGILSRENEKRNGILVPSKGVRGRSIVSKIPFCDRSTVVFAEYMHISRNNKVIYGSLV